MSDTTTNLDEIMTLASQLSPEDKLRVIERLASLIGQDLSLSPAVPKRSSNRSLYGILADLGPAPSEEDIAEVRREMWANFPREDIA
jgi:hypothetical protein